MVRVERNYQKYFRQVESIEKRNQENVAYEKKRRGIDELREHVSKLQNQEQRRDISHGSIDKPRSRGRTAARGFVLIAWLAIFLGYVGPKLNDSVLSPALPDQLKYALDFILVGITSVIIYFGMAGEGKLNAKQVQELSDKVRDETRQEVISELGRSYPKGNPALTQNNPEQRNIFDAETIEVSFAGVGDVSLSHIKNIRSVKVEIPKSEPAEAPQEQSEVKDEIDELLTAQAAQ